MKYTEFFEKTIWLCLSPLITVLLVFSVRASFLNQPQPKMTLSGHQDIVSSVAFSPENHLLASGSPDSTAKIWDRETGQIRFNLTGHTKGVYTVDFSPNGMQLATGSYDRAVKLWNPLTGELLHSLGVEYPVSSVVFSPDSKIIAIGGRAKLSQGHTEGRITVWNTETGQLIHSMSFKPKLGDSALVTAMDFSSDGATLATGGFESKVRLWDMRTGQLKEETKLRCNSQVLFSSDNSSLMTVDWGFTDRGIVVYDLKKKTVVEAIPKEPGSIETIAISPDSRKLATGNNRNEVKVWDLRTKKLLIVLPNQDFHRRSIEFSPDGRTLAISYEGKIKLWDVSDLRACHELCNLKG